MLNIHPPIDSKYDVVLSPAALSLVADLVTQFQPKLNALLVQRNMFDAKTKQRLEKGQAPFTQLTSKDYLPTGASDNWTGPAIPNDLKERHVELTGPAGNARMVYNSFTCGADAYMADFEDSLSPTKTNMLEGQLNMYYAVRGTLKKDGHTMPETPTTLLVRPRGLHLIDSNFELNGQSCAGALIDFGLFIANNAKQLIRNGSGPYFYLPKLEHWEEAALWAEIFAFTEKSLSIKPGTIRATVLIETITAAYEIDAILYALRDYSAGLNCGRWDYIFSFIKKLYTTKQYLLPNRSLVDMQVDFMKNYSLKVVQSCHKRGVHAMGGMSANVPFRVDLSMSDDEQQHMHDLNEGILSKIKNDKTNEAKNGHDGAWAAHPNLVPVIKSVFQEVLQNKPNQIDNIPNVTISNADLIAIPNTLKANNLVTEAGVRINISVGLQYIVAWLNGAGAVGISYALKNGDTNPPRLMEDLATAEISRMQLFQWMHHDVPVKMLDTSTQPIQTIMARLIEEETTRIKANTQIVKYDTTPEIEALKKAGSTDAKAIKQMQLHCIKQFETGCKLFHELCFAKAPADFISLMAYPFL